jgi:glycosyltransferase involved in cell wall biosynthesis
MKIGYIIADFPVLSETFVVNDIRGLEALGHDVTAIALGHADPATVGNPNYAIRGRTVRVKGLNPPVWRKVCKLAARWRLERKYGKAFRRLYHTQPADVPDELWHNRNAWDAAIEQIDREGFDFLYVHFAMRQLLLGYYASRMLDIPLAVTLQAHDIFANGLARFFPQLLGQCAFVVTVSHYNREAILKLAPNLDPQRVHVLANGIDVDRFHPQWHEPSRPFRFAATGRLVEIKGFHVLVEAAGILAKRRKDFLVQIVGEGPLRGHIEKRIAEQGIEEQLELLGRRDASFLQDWLPKQDCFVLPCVIAKDGNRDGMPLALREGMACGLPAISSDLLGLHETVAPGTGLLTRADDAESLAGGLEQMMNLSPAEHRKMAEAARKRAELGFSLAHEVGMLQQWMEEGIATRVRTRTDAAGAAPTVGAGVSSPVEAAVL